MGSSQHAQVKPEAAISAAPPQVSPFQSRGFEEEQQGEQGQESPSLQASLDRASRLGHNFGEISIISPSIQRQDEQMSEEEKEKEKEKVLNAKPGVQMSEGQGEEEVQMKPELQMSGGAAEASPELESSIQTARGGGQPLEGGIRRSMEGAFGADFGGVRIHTDAQADTLNRSISAQAFTTGQDVFFRSGSYSPDSSGGKQLLAHELTHVVQQTGGRVSKKIQAQLTIGQPGDQYEQEADAMAAQVVQRIETGKVQTQENQKLQTQGAQSTVQRKQVGSVAPRIQRQVGGNASSGAPPQEDSIHSGAINLRRIENIDPGAIVQAMQATAQQRQLDWNTANISNSPAGTAIRTFFNDTRNVRAGHFNWGWGYDGAERQFFDAHNYEMRITTTAFKFQSPTQEGIANPSGQTGSSQSGSQQNQTTDSTQSETSTSLGLEGSAGGHEGAPGGTASGGINSTNTDATANQGTRAGGENFDPGQESFNRYRANFKVEYNIAFKPGTLLGLRNIHTRDQNFDGSAVTGDVIFDYIVL